jgi:hypothetical protein
MKPSIKNTFYIVNTLFLSQHALARIAHHDLLQKLKNNKDNCKQYILNIGVRIESRQVLYTFLFSCIHIIIYTKKNVCENSVLEVTVNFLSLIK